MSPSLHSSVRRSLLPGLIVTVALASLPAFAASGTEKPQIKYNPADLGAARAVVLRRADLPGSGWKGGRVKPDLTATTCPSYHPKQADLVVTGAGESDYQRGAVVFENIVQVLKTSHMVALDWQRTVADPRNVPCERYALAHALGKGAKVESFGRISFPHLAKYSREYRGVFTVPIQGQHVRLVTDVVLVGRGRTEISVGITAAASARSAITPLEVALAKKLVARARA
jgi:hypothetical protein